MGAKIIGASEQSYSVQGQQETPVFGQKYVMDDKEWELLCSGLDRLGKIAKEEYGISLTFHHHMGTVAVSYTHLQVCLQVQLKDDCRIKRETMNGYGGFYIMKDTKQQWFKDAKYGLFIHWGLYSILAGEYKGRKTDRIAEWIENDFDIPVEDYEKLAEQFNPTGFDADAFVKRAKEQWGMKYIVLTAKHHEGFAMYDSKVSDFNVVKATPYGRDILKELQLACEKYDVKMSVSYTHLDVYKRQLYGWRKNCTCFQFQRWY